MARLSGLVISDLLLSLADGQKPTEVVGLLEQTNESRPLFLSFSRGGWAVALHACNQPGIRQAVIIQTDTARHEIRVFLLPGGDSLQLEPSYVVNYVVVRGQVSARWNIASCAAGHRDAEAFLDQMMTGVAPGGNEGSYREPDTATRQALVG